MVLSDGSWTSPPVTVAASFTDRFLGMRRESIEGLLIRSSSVHALGLRDPLRLVHLDGNGMVVHQDILPVGRRIAARGVWILELPIGTPAPDTGVRLVVLPSSVS